MDVQIPANLYFVQTGPMDCMIWLSQIYLDCGGARLQEGERKTMALNLPG